MTISDQKTLLFVPDHCNDYQRDRFDLLARYLSNEVGSPENLTYLAASPQSLDFVSAENFQSKPGSDGAARGSVRLVEFIKSCFLVLRKRPNVVIATVSPASVVIFALSLLTFSKRVLVYPAVPWSDKGNSSIFVRLLAKLVDFLLAALGSILVAPTEFARDQIGGKYFFARKKLTNISFPLPRNPSFPVGESEGEKEWKKWFQFKDRLKSGICEELEIPEKSLLLVSFCPLTAEDSLENAVRAIAATSRRVYLLICSEGPERDKILSLVVGLGLSEQIVLLGEVPNPLEFVRAADILLIPRGTGGLSDKVLDGFAAGTAILAGGNQELREILLNDDSLFDPDHVGDLSLNLQELATRRGLVDTLVRAGCEAALKLESSWPEKVINLVQ